MINRKDLRALRRGEIPHIMLPDGYMLKLDDYNKVFLSRGGKKHYYLTDTFLDVLCNKKPINNNMLLFISIVKSIEGIAKRLKKESLTRIKLEKLIEEIKTKYE